MINDNDIKEEGILSLSVSEVFKNLAYLDISHNGLLETGAHILSVSQVMT